MRANLFVALLALAFTASAVAGYVRAPLAPSHVQAPGSSNKRYISDPLAFETVVYTSTLNIGGQEYRLVLVRT